MTTCMLAFGKANASVLVRHSVYFPELIHSRTLEQKSHHSTRARLHSRAEDTTAQRDLFVDILSTNATRRDAKQFLARLRERKATNTTYKQSPGVNLGSLYTPARAIADSPQFIREHDEAGPTIDSELHVSIITLRDVHALDNTTLSGLATTIAQLVRLDMQILLVLDVASKDISVTALKDDIFGQAARLARSIDEHCSGGARVVTDALVHKNDALQFISTKLILDPLSQGIVTIIPSLAYTTTWRTKHVKLEDVLNAAVDLTQPDVRVDRIILLDPLGGIPSRVRNDNAHVFINLQQEHQGIEEELRSMDLGEAESAIHLNNLKMLNSTLTKLPLSSSALIITPAEAAAASYKDDTQSIGAGTRKQKNTLIHNLLTNKPIVSSSLPVARIDGSAISTKLLSATLVKKGMPLALIPGVEQDSLEWKVPVNGISTLDLQNDPRVDLAKLVHLINDSFRRELDVDRYLERISGKLAGLIIAGDYEGGAILTWESPSNSDDPARLVPYLDKFAVLQSSQGSAGVADIVFQAMVRTCFPQGVCWRSRSNNPVNKWYFERASGTWSLPNSQWTMFWTGDGVVENQQRWKDYVDVCQGIIPTWLEKPRS